MDQTRLTAFSDGPLADTVRSAGTVRAFAKGGLVVKRGFDDPYLAGMSENHKTLYIDKRVPKKLTVKGKNFDPAKYLAVHETVERRHMDKGMKYEPAHRLALKAEQKAVVADGIDWNGYQEVMHRLASTTQHEATKGQKPPPDLYKGPFPLREQNRLTKEGDSAPNVVQHFAEGGEVQPVNDQEDEPPIQEGEEETTLPEGHELTPEEVKQYGLNPNGPSSDKETTFPEGHELTPEEVKQYGLNPDGPTEYSAPVEAAKTAAQSVLPGIGSMAAMGYGAARGAALGTLAGGPIGETIGGIGGALLAGGGADYALRNIQDWMAEKLGIARDPAKAQAFQQEHPWLSTAANIAGSMLGVAGPAEAGVGLATRALMGAGQAGLEAASDYYNTGQVDPGSALVAGAMGAAFPGLNKPAGKLFSAGERFGGAHPPAPVPIPPGTPATPGQPGRPDLTPSTTPSEAASGYTRFYHGGDDPTSGGGRWVSPDQEYAKNYRPGQSLHYVDIPESWLSANVNKAYDDTGSSSPAPYVNFEAPEQFAKQMKPVEGDNPQYQVQEAGTRPGTGSTDNTPAPPVGPDEYPNKTGDVGKDVATTARGSPGVDGSVGTSHAAAPVAQGDNVAKTTGNEQSRVVGGSRHYPKEGYTDIDSNVHPDSSGSGVGPEAEILDPTTGAIPSDVAAVFQDNGRSFLTPEAGENIRENVTRPPQPANENEKILYKGDIDPTKQGGYGTSTGRIVDAQEAARIRAQEPKPPETPPGRTPTVGPLHAEIAHWRPEIEAAYQRGFQNFKDESGRTGREDEKAAWDRGANDAMTNATTALRQQQKPNVTDTVARLKDEGLPLHAEAVRQNPANEPVGRRILDDLTSERGPALVDKALLKQGLLLKENAKTSADVDRGNQLIEQARNPQIKEQQKEAATQNTAQNTNYAMNAGRFADVGEGVTVRVKTAEEAAAKVQAAQAAKSAFDKFPPPDDKVPTSKEDKAAFIKRLRDAVAHAKEQNGGVGALSLNPRKRTAAQDWLRDATKLANAKSPSQKAINEFVKQEQLARGGAKGEELRGYKNVDADVALNRRKIDETEGGGGLAPAEDVFNTEDKMIDDIDSKRLGETSQLADNMMGMDHEHWMDEASNKIKVPDTETSEAPTETPATSHDEVGYHNAWEQDAADKAYKQTYQKFGRDVKEGKISDPSKVPEPDQIKRFWNDEKGSLDIDRVKSSLLATAKPVKDWVIKHIVPDMFSQAARYADPKFAKYNAQMINMIKQFKDALDGEWHMFNKMPKYHQIEFMSRFETGNPQETAYLDSLASRIKSMLDNAYDNERFWGSKADYIENYMSHLFENNEAYNSFKSKMVQQYGPTWFQKERAFKTISEALGAGFKLKYTNPIEVVTQRLMASADMMLKMQLLHEMNDMGLAHPISKAPKGLTGAWQTIRAPSQDSWMLAPDIQALWKNGVDAKGLWANEGPLGSIFRGWMKLKNVWMPIKLALSAFHPLHIAAGVLQADNFARGWKYTEGGIGAKLAGGAKEVLSNIGDPLFAVDQKFLWGGGKVNQDFIGKQMRAAMDTPWESKTPWQEEVSKWAQEGGYVGRMSPEEQINADHEFAKAWEEGKWAKWVPAAARTTIEAASKPIFQDWIPNLKDASFYRTAAAYMKAHPEAVNDPQMRGLALREIAKSVDNRYGEMFYKGLFWNRYAKDSAIGSFLSLGWNLGFAREFGGGIYNATGGRYAQGMASRVVQDASSKAAYVASYTGITMAMAGAMSYALSGQAPTTPMDYVFPRAGGVNPDGSPRRLSTMFFTREPVQAAAHIQEQGSVAKGLGQMLWNKMVFEPVLEAFKNRDYFGYQLYNPQANWFKQWSQLAGSTLGDAFNPIALSNIDRAQQTGGGARDKALAVAGFGPAPSYVAKDAMQNRISQLFSEGPGAGVKPYENKARDQARRNARSDLNIAQQNKDYAGAAAARQALMKSGIKPETIEKEKYGTGDVYQFSRLDPQIQKELIPQMNDKQFVKYVMQKSISVKNRVMLQNEWKSSHSGKLPLR